MTPADLALYTERVVAVIRDESLTADEREAAVWREMQTFMTNEGFWE